MDFEGRSESAVRPQNLLTLLKSSFLTLFPGVGRGARGLQRPAVCPSLSAVCWVGDELGMSDGLPVWAERLWVAAGLPQGWPDGCYAPHWPGVRCRGFVRICYTHANHTKKKPHTQPADVHTHVRANTAGRLGRGVQMHARLEGSLRGEKCEIEQPKLNLWYLMTLIFLAEGLQFVMFEF